MKLWLLFRSGKAVTITNEEFIPILLQALKEIDNGIRPYEDLVPFYEDNLFGWEGPAGRLPTMGCDLREITLWRLTGESEATRP